MNGKSRKINKILTALLALGIVLSAFHFHLNDDLDHYGEADGFYTQDIVECVLCASHFKALHTDADVEETILLPETYLFSNNILFVSEENVLIYKGRAPPLS